jgi:UPF0716 protein FxsA
MTPRSPASRMRRLAWLLLIPLADALLLVVVADTLGWPLTVALVVLTGLLGLVFVRAEGRHTLTRIQRRLAAGEVPTDELVDGGLLVAAGAFLLTPGLVTDALGALLVFPPTRFPVRKLVKRVAGDRIDLRTGGFASGEVYTGGFPDEDARQRTDDDVHDVPDDAYEVEFEDDDPDGA